MAANDNKDFASLKGLLFSDEAQDIAALKQQMASVDARVGSDGKLTQSVATILAGALRQAEVKNHAELAQSLSPLVVASIRREIVESRDAMVEALYPITGRLVSSYVAGAIQKLSEDINARFDALLSPQALTLRLRALLSGQSYAALMLAENARFHVSQILLVEAHSGLCLARWPQEAPSNLVSLHNADSAAPGGEAVAGPAIAAGNVDMISALLTAIMDFSREAFANANSELRSLNFGTLLLLLRRSPQYIVAAVGTGQVTPAYEQMVDEEFLNILDVLNRAPDQAEGLLARLHDKLEIAATITPKKRRFNPALLAALVLGGAVLAFAGWSLWRSMEERRLAAAVQAIETAGQARGYPVRVSVGDGVRLSGLVPDSAAYASLVAQTNAAFPGKKVDVALTVTPDGQRMEGLEAGLKDVARDAQRLGEGLARLEGEQARLQALIGAQEANNVQNLTALRQALNEGVVKQVDGVTQKLNDTAQSTSAILAQKQVAVDDLAAGLKGVSEDIRALQAQIHPPRAQLRDWLELHAIYFGDVAEFRDGAATQNSLAQLAALLRDMPQQKIRIIGYSDERAVSNEANHKVSLLRAQKVADYLFGLGVKIEQMIVVARGSGLRISENDGAGSTNRRVTFELAAEGE